MGGKGATPPPPPPPPKFQVGGHHHFIDCLQYCNIIRGVARISQGGVQFAEILLTTPTLKTTPIYS